jgi:hypothetical protein
MHIYEEASVYAHIEKHLCKCTFMEALLCDPFGFDYHNHVLTMLTVIHVLEQKSLRTFYCLSRSQVVLIIRTISLA